MALRRGRDCGTHGTSGAPAVPYDEHDRCRREVRKDEPQQAGLVVAREVPRETPGIGADERALIEPIAATPTAAVRPCRISLGINQNAA